MGIFQRKGHAMQRPPHFTAGQRLVRCARPFLCVFGVQGDDGIQRRIVFVDLRQVRVQYFSG
jgi:hypothetical protein